MKQTFVEISKNALLLLFAVFLSLASIEGVLRYFNFPVQSLRPENIYDDILLHRLPSDYPGVDKDGFRNLDVKSHADIVAIGDSHTYGFNVDIDNTWPRYISKMTGKTVYNFGMGGYGPLQYYYLSKRALEMTPTHIIIGLYLPNDLAGVCSLFLKSVFWKEYSREEGLDLKYCYDFGEDLGPQILKRKERYAWADMVFGPIERFRKETRIAALLRIVRPKWLWIMNPSPKKYLIINDDRNKTLIRRSSLKSSAKYMDLRREEVANGLGITKKILYLIAKRSQRSNIKLVVLLIPSKEMVFYDYLLRGHSDLPGEYHELVRNERELKSVLKAFLTENKIPYVDGVTYLEQALYSQGNVYPPNSNRDTPWRQATMLMQRRCTTSCG